MAGQLETDGVTIAKQVLSENAAFSLRTHFDAVSADGPGARAFDLPQDIQAVIGEQGPVGALAASLAAGSVKPVRILFFDKTPASNWAVPWHQDRTIAVKERHDIEGYGPWTNKNGVVHVEPPVTVLESMLTLRLFIDDCGAENGPLEVARGSHRDGRVPAGNVKNIVEQSEIFVGTGRSGDVLAMRLLVIHSSKRAQFPTHRRVLHVDYASLTLPAPLEWALH
jgi:phytanoyl-CoA dioxygenase PhyH